MCRNFWQLRRLIVLVALSACNNADETNPAEVGFDIDISGHDGYELGMSSRAAADVKLDYQYQPCGEHAGCYVSPTLYLQYSGLLQVVEDTRRRQIRQIRLYFDQPLNTDCTAMLNHLSQHLSDHYGPSQPRANHTLVWLARGGGYVQLQQSCQNQLSQTNGQVLLVLSLDLPAIQ